jgi:hypothetical protein
VLVLVLVLVLVVRRFLEKGIIDPLGRWLPRWRLGHIAAITSTSTVLTD